MTAKKPLNKLKNTAVLAHVLTTVPVVDLEQYLLTQPHNKLLFIHHPLKNDGSRSRFQLFQQSTLQREATFVHLPLPFLVQYLKDVLLSLYWLITQGPRWNTIIALDNLNALAALILRRFGLVNFVVYYTIDYIPQRFSSPFINELYHKIDDFCTRHADSVWNVSPRIAEARQEFRHISPQETKQLTVPIGIWLERFPYQPFNTIDPYHLVYAGGLLPHQGIQEIIAALPTIIKKIPQVHLSVIGLGSYESELKKLVSELKLEKQVAFLGYFENHDDVAQFCSNCGLAIALYSQDLDVWSRYADPSKMKTYLAAGLPIITTNVTHFAQTLVETESGVIVTPNTAEISHTIISLLQQPKRHKNMRENARNLAKQYQWEKIFSTALQIVTKR